MAILNNITIRSVLYTKKTEPVQNHGQLQIKLCAKGDTAMPPTPYTFQPCSPQGPNQGILFLPCPLACQWIINCNRPCRVCMLAFWRFLLQWKSKKSGWVSKVTAGEGRGHFLVALPPCLFLQTTARAGARQKGLTLRRYQKTKQCCPHSSREAKAVELINTADQGEVTRGLEEARTLSTKEMSGRSRV